MSKNIKLYALSTCIHCRQVKELLEENNHAYDCIYVDKLEGEERKSVIEDIKALNPKLSFPTICIDDLVIVGSKKDKILEALQ